MIGSIAPLIFRWARARAGRRFSDKADLFANMIESRGTGIELVRSLAKQYSLLLPTVPIAP